MQAREKILTGLALSLLAYWEMGIGEIPLGLFSISHTDQSLLFPSLILLKLLVSATLISLGLGGPVEESGRFVDQLLRPKRLNPKPEPDCAAGEGAITTSH